MAKVYPSPIPAKALNDPAREAERKTYDTLASQLDDAYSVFYSVAWLSKAAGNAAQDGEVDFVVIHPDLGALLLEVKGGSVWREQMTGQWRSTSRSGKLYDIHDPFEQVRASKYALVEKFHEHPSLRRAWVPLAHGVVLPDTPNPARPLAPDAPPEITVFRDDMPRLGDRVRGMFDYWRAQGGRTTPPSRGFAVSLTELLAPPTNVPRPLGWVLEDDDKELLRLTEEQFGVFDMLARQRRVEISGGAGTGKTVLAMEKARRLAAEGHEVLLTCFNRPLADHMRRSLGATERLTIANFHQLCWETAKEAGLDLPPLSTKVPSEFFDATLPTTMLDALDRLPTRRFDAIVVDEGQDFLESWWTPLLLCAKDAERGILYVFHDDNQQVYHRVASFPSGLSPACLTKNLRNTQAIHRFTQSFYDGDRQTAIGPEGEPVTIVCVARHEQIEEAVEKALHKLLIVGGVPRCDVAVLLGSSRDVPFASPGRIGRYETTSDQAAGAEKVVVDSVRRFKGLDRKAVILTAIDSLDPMDERVRLYVGSSRARTHLTIVATKATIERLRPSI